MMADSGCRDGWRGSVADGRFVAESMSSHESICIPGSLLPGEVNQPGSHVGIFPTLGADAGVEIQLSLILWEEIPPRASPAAPADRDQPGPVPKSLAERYRGGWWRGLLRGSDAAQHVPRDAP